MRPLDLFKRFSTRTTKGKVFDIHVVTELSIILVFSYSVPSWVEARGDDCKLTFNEGS